MAAIHILPAHFFAHNDTLWLARYLLGKILTTHFDGKRTSGRIVETEAYLGETDRASHAFGGRRTARTETMYLPGGHVYIYLCYGIHHLFNIVTHEINVPHAILIRGLEPVNGVSFMMERRKKKKLDKTITRGPGSLSQAMGIHYKYSGKLLQQPELFIADDGFRYNEDLIVSSPRIGVDYAGEDAKLPYRFFIKGNQHVSGKTT